MEGNGKISVMVVDDHDRVRAGLRIFLQISDVLTIVGEAPNGAVATQLYEQHKPDVVLMDLLMPKMDGIATAKKIIEEDPDAKIIALTSYEGDDLVQSAIDVGIKGYILKTVSVAYLESVIIDVYEGEIIYDTNTTNGSVTSDE